MTKDKLVPELRFPEFEEKWNKEKLISHVEVIDGDRGKNYPKKSEMTEDGYCLFLNASNVTRNGFKFNEKKYITKEKDRALRSGKLKRNDIVLTTRGTVGNIAYYDQSVIYEDIRINSGMIILRSENINTQYFLYYLLNTYIFEKILSIITFGSAQPQLTKRDLSELKFKFPSEVEQNKIASFFSAIDKKIELQKELIENLEEEKKGLMQKIFNQEVRFKDDNGEDYPEWEDIQLGTIAKIKTGNSNVQDSVENGKYNFFDRSVDIKKMNKFDYDEEAIIYPGEGSQFLPQYYKGKYALHQRAYSITSDKINMRYLNYMLMQRNNHFLRMAVGSTVKSLRMDNFEKCPIYLPIIEEQNKIAGFLSLADKRIDLEKEQLENYKEYKKALMQRMFI